MIQFLKNIVLSLAALLAAISVHAEGVTYTPIPVTNAPTSGTSLTNAIPAAMIYSNPVLISVSDFSDVGISLTGYKGLGDGSNCTVILRRSWNNGVTYENTGSITWTVPLLANLNTNSYGTNIIVGSASALQLFTITNGSTNGGLGTLNLTDFGYILKDHHN